MKKCSKLWIFVISMFFMMSHVSARMMSISEIGEKAKEITGDYANYIFVIGEYAFTDEHILTAKDIMNASRSISLDVEYDGTNLEEVLDQMNVQQIGPKIEKMKVTGWEVRNNIVGSKKIDGNNKINIKYIDYHVIPDDSTTSTELNVDDPKYSEYVDVLQNNLNFEASKFYGDKLTISSDGKVTGLLLKNKEVSLSPSDQIKYKDAEYFFAYILEVPNANEDTTIKVTNIYGETKTITWESFDVTEDGKTPGIVLLAPISKKAWDKNKTMTIVVDVDGAGEFYKENKITLDLSGLTFQETSAVTLNNSYNDVSETDKTTLTTWGYHHELNKDLKIEPKGEDNSYKLTGKVDLQHIKEGVFGSAPEDGYYFLFNLKKPDTLKDIPDGVNVTVTGTQTFTYGKIYFNENGVFTELFKLKNSCNNDCIIKIKVDWDGNGKQYLESQEITIDYSGLTFVKGSTFSVEAVDNSAKQQLKTDFGWEPKDGFDVQFNTSVSPIKVSGLIPILDNFGDKHPFTGDDVTGYYLPFTIKTTTEKMTEENKKTTVKIISKDEKTITITADSFDDTNKLYVLRHLHKDAKDKTFKIIVDMDGDGDEYSPYELDFDWSDLKLQEQTEPSVKLNNPSKEDTEELNSYKYDKNKNENLHFEGSGNSVTLAGTLKEQVVDSSAFGADNINGYYFDFTFTIPNGVDRSKVKIARLESDDLNGAKKKEFEAREWNTDGTLTILYRIPKDPDCKNHADTCKIYYSVDYDGDGKEYLPTLYTIDYSGVTFQKSSLVHLDPVSENTSSTEWKGFTKDENYNVDFKEQSSTFKVTGLITIFDDTKWSDSKNPFANAEDYYLAFKLSKAEVTGVDTDTIVKFLTEGEGHDDKHTIGKADFGDNKSIYVLKYLNPNKDGGSKKFTITVDFDDNDEEYEPYTITIDWSGLYFQYESIYTDNKLVLTPDTSNKNSVNYISPEDKEKMTNTWGYQFENAGKDLTITYENGLKLGGSVKEQNVNAGFNSSKGYYIPIKIYGPTAEQVKGTILETDNKKWNIKVYNENEELKTITPSATDYENGFVVVLFKLKNEGNSKAIKYIIDCDGDGNYFLPFNEEIDYSSVNFLSAHKVTFDYQGLETSNKVVTFWDGDKIVAPTDVVTSDDVYHEFAYWNKEDGTKADSITLYHETGDVTLVPHWNLYSDKFVADILKDLNATENSKTPNFSTEFVVEDYKDNSGEIIINVLDPTIKVSRINDTSIPGAIAYILLKDEIKSITLEADSSHSKTFTKGEETVQDTFKANIIEELKNLYSSILTDNFNGQTDEQLTLSAIAQNETYKSFKIKFDADTIPSTVTLVKTPSANGISSVADVDVPTEYTITFNSDIVNVKNENDLKAALKGTATKIYLEEGFAITNKIDIDRAVTIDGKGKTLTSSISENGSMFNITSSGVTIKNVTLDNAKPTAITVTSGSLTTESVTITGTALEAGIEVKDGATLNASSMTFDSEHYTKPLVRADKTNAKVNLTDSESKPAIPIHKETINQNNAGSDSKEPAQDYPYINYYNKQEHSKIYKSEIYNYHGGFRVVYTKYNYYNEALIPPTVGEVFTEFTRDGEHYELIGFTEKSNLTLTDNNLPDGAVAKDKLFITKDNGHYWGVFKVTVAGGAKIVTDESQFKEAITKLNDGEEINAIHINASEALTIDYTKVGDGTFEIKKDVSIIGQNSPKVTIKAKKIVIGKDVKDVFMQRVSLEVEAQDGQEALIEVDGKEFSLWQSGLKNIGEPVNYAIKYNNTTSIVDIKYMGAGYSPAFDSTNINKSYIYVSGNLAAGSNLISNTFPEGTSKTKDKMSAIIIHGFAADATVREEEDGEPDIRFESNTVKTPYGIIFEKEVSEQTGDIKLGSATIGIEYDTAHTNFEGIGFYAKPENVTVKYINQDDGSVSESEPQSVKAPKFKGQTVASEPVSISGLTKDGDSYSGLISQSVDGKFYLPLTLTSTKFDDRKSKVIVTDPNGEKTEYLYSEYSDNGVAPIRTFSLMSNQNTVGTMKLNLEAMKTSKIKDGNKEYQIEVDYDGNGQTDDSYTIDYNGVRTEEEIVLDAVKKTMAANNYTFTKDNYIKNRAEAFTSKFDKGKYYDLYADENHTQYSFRLRDVVPSHQGPIVITVEKAEEGYTCSDNTCKPVINGWKFSNFFSQVSMGSHELSLLQDVIVDTKVETDAIQKVERSEDPHTFIVTLNTERLNEWLNNAYLDSQKELENEKNKESSESNHEGVKIKVVLNDTEDYLKSFQTIETFDIVANEKTTYHNNRISVQYESIGSTKIDDPKTILGTEGTPATEEEIEAFYEKCKAWHKYSTGADIYEG